MFEDVLKRFTDYQNAAVKHDEKCSLRETEFIIYTTGAFMRLLLKLESESRGETAPGR